MSPHAGSRNVSHLRELYRLEDTPQRRVSVLSNGLTVIPVRMDGSMASVRVFLRAGCALEGEWAGSGISHLFEHVITCGGTTTHTEKQLIEQADELGGLCNAYTSCDHICYFINTPVENMAGAVDLLAGYVVRPELSEAVFRRELGVVQRELERDRDDPDVQLEELFHEIMYPGHPMRHTIIGHREQLLALRYDDIVRFHAIAHAPENIVVVIAADAPADHVVRLVCGAFGDLRRRCAQWPRPPAPRPIIGPRRAMRCMDVESASAVSGWMTVPEGHPDDVPLDLLYAILLESDDARLVRDLRWERQIVYQIDGTHDCTWHTPGTFQVAAQLEPHRLAEFESGVLNVLDRLAAEPITEDELARAKIQSLVDIKQARQTADGLATQVGEDYLATANAGYADLYIERINVVRRDEVMDVAARYLKATQRILAVVAPDDSPALPRPRAAKSHGARPKPSAGKPSHAPAPSDARGVLVHAMPVAEFFAVSIVAPGGLHVETDANSGIGNLMTETMLRGTQKTDADALAAFFASRGAMVRASISVDAFAFECFGLCEDFDPLIARLAEIVREPAFAALEIARLRPSICDAIERIEEDWTADLIRFARRHLLADSPYRLSRIGDIRGVEAQKPGTLRDHHAHVLDAGCVVSVAGNVTERQVRRAVEGSLAGLTRDQVGPLLSPAGSPQRLPFSEPQLYVKQAPPDREFAGIFVGYPGCAATDLRQRAPVCLLAAMLAGYALSGGRLYSALRSGEQDLVYEVAGSHLMAALPGYFGVRAACQADRLREVYDAIVREIDALRNGAFDDAELRRARSMVLTAERDALQMPVDFARRAAHDAILGLGCGDAEAFEREICAADRAAVLRVAESMWTQPFVAVLTSEPDKVDLEYPPRLVQRTSDGAAHVSKRSSVSRRTPHD